MVNIFFDPSLEIFHKGGHFWSSRTNFKTAYRSEFLSDFNNQMCVEKLTPRRIQKNKSHLMCTHQAQNRLKILHPHILAILRAKCTQEKNDILFWILRDLSFVTHVRLSNLNKNSLLYDILNFGEYFFLTPFLKFFIRGVIFGVRVQILKRLTEASFCPILIIESALKSWDPVEFKKISYIFLAYILHSE